MCCDALRRLADKGQKAVIVGGGYIGVEVAVVLRQMGLEVYVVEILPQILMATTEPGESKMKSLIVYSSQSGNPKKLGKGRPQ